METLLKFEHSDAVESSMETETYEITIPTFRAKQIGGDIDPGTHGGTIAKADGITIDVTTIQPTISCIGENDALDVGFPFWTKKGSYSAQDLDPNLPDVKWAMAYVDLTLAVLEELKPEDRAVAIAEACIASGYLTGEGSAGWAKDVVWGRVQWWASTRPRGWRFLKDSDSEFRQLLKDR